MKNWLIKKLGGFTVEQVSEIEKSWDNTSRIIVEQNQEYYQQLQVAKEKLQQVQLELERAKDWRNHVAKVLRQNKIPRHIVNRLMEMKND